MSFVICWKYKDKSGRGDKKYPSRQAAYQAIKKLNPDITYWIVAAEQSVQSDASPVERCQHGNKMRECFEPGCSFNWYGERR